MPRYRRYIPEGEPSVVEITNRTIQSLFLLRPGPEFNDVVHGALARAQRRYEVPVHAHAFLSNHYHLLATVHSARQLAAFVGYYQSKIAKEVCRRHEWRDKVWARRYKHIVAVDAEAQIERLIYLLENGCKEGLVASPVEWPGAHCARALATGAMEIAGTWFDRTQQWVVAKRREEISESDFVEPETLHLTPIPCWRGLSDSSYTSRVSEIIDDIETRTRQMHTERESRPLGVAEIRRQDPHGRPIKTKLEPAPLVHATTKAARLAFRAAYQAFLLACSRATERLIATGDTSGFPEGAFLPPFPVAALDTG